MSKYKNCLKAILLLRAYFYSHKKKPAEGGHKWMLNIERKFLESLRHFTNSYIQYKKGNTAFSKRHSRSIHSQ